MKKISNIAYASIVLIALIAIFLVWHQKPGISDEFYVLTAKAPLMREQFAAGNIDGFLVHHPFAADAFINENASYLMHSSEIWPNHPCCLLTAKMENDDEVRALLWAHMQATKFINDENNREKVISYAKDFTGLDEKVIKESLKHIRYVEYPDEEGIKEYYNKLSEARFFIKSLKDLGYEAKEDFFNELFDKSHYNYIKQNPEWKPEFINKTIRLGYFPANLHHLAGYVALQEEFYSAVFQKIELVPFADGNKVMEGYKIGLIDASYIGVLPLILKRINENIEATIIGGANEEGSALVVKKDIKSLNELKGKTIAILGLGTMPDFLLRVMAEKAGLEFQLKK